MSRFINRIGQLTVDLLVLTVAFVVAFGLRFDFDIPMDMLKRAAFLYPYVLALELFVLSLFGVPRFAWRYVGLREAGRIAAATGIVSLVLLAIRFAGAAAVEGMPAAKYSIVPMGVIVINATLLFLGIVGVRVGRRLLYERSTATRSESSHERSPVLLVGAGRAGVQVARELKQRPDLGLRAVGFIDNDPVKKDTEIHGLKVLGSATQLKEICEKHGVKELIITIASANGATLRELVRQADASGVKAKIIPGIGDILNGNINLSRIRPVRIEDLLGRDAVHLETNVVGSMLRSKCVLVTGAGGSIGSELCRQIAQLEPASVILVERAEPALFNISQELGRSNPDLRIVAALCDVTDAQRLEAIFQRFQPNVVFHAAAHKHVPLMEENPGEAIKNNVFGTVNVANTADRFGADAMVLVSTDKAVNPTSIMGATKRVAEMYVQAMSGRSTTRYVAVRFGNVLGSTGSVIPTFQKQIERGGPVTVTHPDMKRYFMTIPEASQLVMQAGAMGQGGEIFVLDMGSPVRIKDLAEDLIRLSGFEPDVDVAIEYCGVRPGEKLFEELGFDAEKMSKTRHRKIYIGKQAPTQWAKLQAGLSLLATLGGAWDRAEVEIAMRSLVPEMLDPETGPPAQEDAARREDVSALMGHNVPSLDPA